jgi:hypothetical protein
MVALRMPWYDPDSGCRCDACGLDCGGTCCGTVCDTSTTYEITIRDPNGAGWDVAYPVEWYDDYAGASCGWYSEYISGGGDDVVTVSIEMHAWQYLGFGNDACLEVYGYDSSVSWSIAEIGSTGLGGGTIFASDFGWDSQGCPNELLVAIWNEAIYSCCGCIEFSVIVSGVDTDGTCATAHPGYEDYCGQYVSIHNPPTGLHIFPAVFDIWISPDCCTDDHAQTVHLDLDLIGPVYDIDAPGLPTVLTTNDPIDLILDPTENGSPSLCAFVGRVDLVIEGLRCDGTWEVVHEQPAATWSWLDDDEYYANGTCGTLGGTEYGIQEFGIWGQWTPPTGYRRFRLTAELWPFTDACSATYGLADPDQMDVCGQEPFATRQWEIATSTCQQTWRATWDCTAGAWAEATLVTEATITVDGCECDDPAWTEVDACTRELIRCGSPVVACAELLPPELPVDPPADLLTCCPEPP